MFHLFALITPISQKPLHILFLMFSYIYIRVIFVCDNVVYTLESSSFYFIFNFVDDHFAWIEHSKNFECSSSLSRFKPFEYLTRFEIAFLASLGSSLN
jgi:hypothetical protein